jgi:hypothetical protein
VTQYFADASGEFLKCCQEKRNPVTACPTLLKKLNELGVSPGLPVSLQIPLDEGDVAPEEISARKKKLSELVRVAVGWNLFDGLEVLDPYPEFKTPIAALRYVWNLKAFRSIPQMKMILTTLVFAKHVKKVPEYPRDRVPLVEITFLCRWQYVWATLLYLAQLVYGKKNAMEIVEGIWTCPASLISYELLPQPFSQPPSPPSLPASQPPSLPASQPPSLPASQPPASQPPSLPASQPPSPPPASLLLPSLPPPYLPPSPLSETQTSACSSSIKDPNQLQSFAKSSTSRTSKKRSRRPWTLPRAASRRGNLREFEGGEGEGKQAGQVC